jgi:hypothetical protein
MADNGTEDYFGGAWGFCDPVEAQQTPGRYREQTFNAPYLGLPLAAVDDPSAARRFSLYRWHILDPIGFESDLKVTVQALGVWPDGTWQPRSDDIASLSVWYQDEPHQPFPELPPLEFRWGN